MTETRVNVGLNKKELQFIDEFAVSIFGDSNRRRSDALRILVRNAMAENKRDKDVKPMG